LRQRQKGRAGRGRLEYQKRSQFFIYRQISYQIRILCHILSWFMTLLGLYADSVKEGGRTVCCGGEVGVSSVRTSLRLDEEDAASSRTSASKIL
jgi:hypothetical protein